MDSPSHRQNILSGDFESRRIWTLSPGPGLKRIYVLLRSGTHVRSGWDQIVRL